MPQRPDAPFLDAGASLGSYGARTTDAFTLGADVKDGGVDQGLDALLLEARRANLGFLDSELARAKADMLRGLEQSYAERDKTVSGAYVSAYMTNFLSGAAIPAIDTRYRLAQALVPSITVADVDSLAKRWITPNNRVIIVEAPDKAGVSVPTQADVGVRPRQGAAREPVTAYTESVSAAPPGVGTAAGWTRGRRANDCGRRGHRVDPVERRARAGQTHGLQERRGRRDVIRTRGNVSRIGRRRRLRPVGPGYHGAERRRDVQRDRPRKEAERQGRERLSDDQ